VAHRPSVASVCVKEQSRRFGPSQLAATSPETDCRCGAGLRRQAKLAYMVAAVWRARLQPNWLIHDCNAFIHSLRARTGGQRKLAEGARLARLQRGLGAGAAHAAARLALEVAGRLPHCVAAAPRLECPGRVSWKAAACLRGLRRPPRSGAAAYGPHGWHSNEVIQSRQGCKGTPARPRHKPRSGRHKRPIRRSQVSSGQPHVLAGRCVLVQASALTLMTRLHSHLVAHQPNDPAGEWVTCGLLHAAACKSS